MLFYAKSLVRRDLTTSHPVLKRSHATKTRSGHDGSSRSTHFAVRITLGPDFSGATLAGLLGNNAAG
jgi:hypothetical protein